MSTPQPPGTQRIALQADIPVGVQVVAEILIIIPLSNGTVQINIPQNGGIPLALGMMGDALAALGNAQKMYNQQHEQQKPKSNILLADPLRTNPALLKKVE